MQISNWLRLAVLGLCLVATSAARGASTTNFTDQWWNPGESGWGASVLQQADMLFVDLFVYGSDGKPTWFTAAAPFQGSTGVGNLVFAGDLYATTGPRFAGAFDPAGVSARKVGTLAFSAPTVTQATLSYTVDGVTVTKSITRQWLRNENFSGNYVGGLIYDASQCVNAADGGHIEEFGQVSISQTGLNVTIASQTSASTCTYAATYTQSGHMGAMQGTYSCSTGINGTFSIFEMERSISGMTGRFVAQNNACKVVVGRLGGLLR